MPVKDLFEYAVIRIVPRVEREEFLNVGVIVYCTKQKFLQVKYSLDKLRLASLHPECDMDCVADNLASFEKIARGEKGAGTISLLDIAGRFRWLTATRSTVVQTSRVHPGLCENAGEMLERLFEQLVL